MLECLEDRVVPSTFVVTKGLGNGTGSLDWAITSSNADTGQTNTIDFLLGTTNSILPTSTLPAITNPVIINGLSNPGTHDVLLAGGFIHGSTNGLVIDANGCTIEGFDIVNFHGNGLVITSAHNTIVTNAFGGLLGSLTASGEGARRPHGNGIAIEGQNAYGNTIGGTTAGAANIISSNTGDGLFIDGGSNNVVIGNFIGTDRLGSLGLGNGLDGIHLLGGATFSSIGEEPGGAVAGNVISGNGRFGVEISGAATTANYVAGNKIGTNKAGTQANGNDLAASRLTSSVVAT